MNSFCCFLSIYIDVVSVDKKNPKLQQQRSTVVVVEDLLCMLLIQNLLLPGYSFIALNTAINLCVHKYWAQIV